MFCTWCGKLNVDHATFCAFCGKAVVPPPVTPAPETTHWDYNFVSRVWDSGEGRRWNLVLGVTEYSVRQDNWGSDQNWIMPEIQEYLDKGWQYVNPPGPNSYKFMENTDYSGSIKFKWLSVSSFVVDFRRPARPLKEKEQQLVGVWEKCGDPNKGFWNTLGNVIFDQKLTVSRYRYEFHKDHTFQRFEAGGEETNGGVFFEGEDGEIWLFYKYVPEENAPVRLNGNQLVLKGKRYQIEFERVNPT